MIKLYIHWDRIYTNIPFKDRGDILRAVNKFAAGLFLMLLLTFIGSAVNAKEPSASHETPDGIRLLSYTKVWDVELLASLETELKQNIHGIEMDYIDRVEMHPGDHPDGNSDISALYHRERQVIDIPVKLSGFLPDEYSLPVEIDKGVIKIFHSEQRESIEEAALDLSHEYGHHFTFFHFDEAFASDEQYTDSEYYQVRGLKDYDRVNGSSSFDRDKHKWSIYEMAAEDYKQIMGSRTGKISTVFKDISQKASADTYQPMNIPGYKDFNAVPQINWEIPLPHQVDRLAEYFYSFIDDQDVPVVSVDGDAESPAYNDLPSVSYKRESYHGLDRYVLSWESYLERDDLVYTLVVISDDYSEMLPIKTVFPGEAKQAVIGTYTLENDGYVYYYKDGIDQRAGHFRLHVQFPDGQLAAGPVTTIDFLQ